MSAYVKQGYANRGPRIDLSGQQFGEWTVVSYIGSREHKWLCRCTCGGDYEINGQNLREGKTRSCRPCIGHGMDGTPEYRAWEGIKYRCFIPTCEAWANYGGRGITMHPAWVHDFKAFYAWVGPRPEPHPIEGRYSIDRWPNNDGNYEPGNIRWATFVQQNNNRRSSLHLKSA